MNALQKCQWRHDNAEPDNNDAERDYIDGQASLLISGEDANGIAWPDFALVATENLCGEDDDQFVLLKILLNLRNGHLDAAQLLYEAHFDSLVCECAEGMVRHRLSKVAA